MAKIDVSVIIVSWNTRDILRDCLESVYTQTRDRSFEVIVIDNASADGSPEMIKRDFPQVRLIENADNRGFAAGNNQGVEVATGRYVLLLNSDTIVLDGAIDKTVAFADRHLRAAVVGCRVLNRDMTWQPSCFMFPSALNLAISALCLNKLLSHSRLFGRERMTWWDGKDTRVVDVVTGCFMLVRREALQQVGVLDESYFMYGEETDWCYRFRNAEWTVLFFSTAQIVHLGGASSAKLKGPMRLQLGASTLLFIRKHGTVLSYMLSCVFVSLFFLLRLPVWLMRALSCRTGGRDCWSIVRAYAAGAWKALWGWQALRFRK